MQSTYQFYIPLYEGPEGDLWECVRSHGEKITQLDPIWITPGYLFESDELSLEKITVLPKVHKFQGEFKFEYYDKRQMSQRQWIANIWINADTHTYRIEKSDRYARRRLVGRLFAHTNSRLPDPAYAFYNNTPDGDFKYLNL